MSDYDSGDDIFITQSKFRENVDMQEAVDAADSLLQDLCTSCENGVCTGGKVVEHLDFSNHPEQMYEPPEDLFDDPEFAGDFPDVSCQVIVLLKLFVEL